MELGCQDGAFIGRQKRLFASQLARHGRTLERSSKGKEQAKNRQNANPVLWCQDGAFHTEDKHPRAAARNSYQNGASLAKQEEGAMQASQASQSRAFTLSNHPNNNQNEHQNTTLPATS